MPNFKWEGTKRNRFGGQPIDQLQRIFEQRNTPPVYRAPGSPPFVPISIDKIGVADPTQFLGDLAGEAINKSRDAGVDVSQVRNGIALFKEMKEIADNADSELVRLINATSGWGATPDVLIHRALGYYNGPYQAAKAKLTGLINTYTAGIGELINERRKTLEEYKKTQAQGASEKEKRDKLNKLASQVAANPPLKGSKPKPPSRKKPKPTPKPRGRI